MQRVLEALGRIRLVTVERNRRADITADDAPLLVVMDGAHTTRLTDFMDTAYEMQLAVDGAISAEQDADLGPNLNALYAATIAALMADQTLDGVATLIREDGLGIRIASAKESELPLGFFSLDVTIEYRTGDGQPYVTGG
jgi:hypothetical protein